VYASGEASGVSNTMRQVGSSLGAAIIGAILLSSLSSNLSAGILSSTVIPEQAKAQIAQAVSTQTSSVEFGSGAHLSGQVSPQITQEIQRISHQATVDADRLALKYGAFFAFIGFLLSFGLPSKLVSHEGESKPSAVH
jgi:hypothetical protein